MHDPWRSAEARAAATDVFRLGGEYPVLRPEDAEVRTAVAAAAAATGGRALGPDVVEPLFALVLPPERERLAALADDLAPARWRRLVRAAGAEAAEEPLLAGVLTAAIAERRPPRAALVRMREETMDFAPGSLNVLAAIVHPESVWSLDEVEAAQELAAPLRGEVGFAAVALGVAEATLRGEHLGRVRTVAEPVAAALPVRGAPRASAALADACTRVAGSDDAAAETARLLFLTYVMVREGLVPRLAEDE